MPVGLTVGLNGLPYGCVIASHMSVSVPRGRGRVCPPQICRAGRREATRFRKMRGRGEGARKKVGNQTSFRSGHIFFPLDKDLKESNALEGLADRDSTGARQRPRLSGGLPRLTSSMGAACGSGRQPKSTTENPTDGTRKNMPKRNSQMGPTAQQRALLGTSHRRASACHPPFRTEGVKARGGGGGGGGGGILFLPQLS